MEILYIPPLIYTNLYDDADRNNEITDESCLQVLQHVAIPNLAHDTLRERDALKVTVSWRGQDFNFNAINNTTRYHQGRCIFDVVMAL